MVLRILPVVLLTLIASDAYLYFKLMYKRKRSPFLQTLFFLPNLLLLLTALILTFTESHSPQNMNQMAWFFSLYMLVVLPKMVFLLIDIMGVGVSLLLPKLRKACTTISTVSASLMFCIMVFGTFFGPEYLKVRHVEYSYPELPASFDGYRIVQISDLHLTSFKSHPETIEKLVRLINEEKPDLIAFTGDLVSIDVQEMDGFEKVLSQLQAPDGIYSVMGNHDYLTYAHYLTPEEQSQHRQILQKRQQEMGWKLLLNEHHIIRKGSDSIAIIGVENDGKPPFPERGDLKKAMNGISGYGKTDAETSGLFKILLSHDPTHWHRKVLPLTDIQLTLSGHTHGMQFMILGWSPSQYIYPEWKHTYTENGRNLHVSLGVGGALIPFRFGAWPEFNVITLHHK